MRNKYGKIGVFMRKMVTQEMIQKSVYLFYLILAQISEKSRKVFLKFFLNM